MIMCGMDEMLDENSCECVPVDTCDIVCEDNEMLDEENCTCIPNGPTEEFTCNAYGKKVCLDVDPDCGDGKFWRKDACMCFSMFQCR